MTATDDANGQVLRGSCLCGTVAYRIEGPFRLVARCHCLQCRKASGAEFATNASASRAGFEVLRGGDRVRAFESSPGQFREFCGDCGSPLWKRRTEDPDTIRIRLGNVDDAFAGPVQFRSFTAEKLALTELTDDGLTTFETAPGAKRD